MPLLRPGLYLRVGGHGELGGQADVRHPAFGGEGHGVGQGVFHLDGSCGTLPDGARHLEGLDDTGRGDPETHHVVQELTGHLVSEDHLRSQGEGRGRVGLGNGLLHIFRSSFSVGPAWNTEPENPDGTALPAPLRPCPLAFL